MLQNWWMIWLAGIVASLVAGSANAAPEQWQSMQVAASAYNSVSAQTTRDNPTTAAWGDVLEPGMHAIAVSHDLIEKGLTHGTKVRIEGLPGVYTVLDKMAARWRNKIDIYMGHDENRARRWGIKRNLRIHYADASDVQ